MRGARDFAQAETMYRAVLAVQEERLSPGHYLTARTRMRLGQTLMALESWDEAEVLLTQAVKDFSGKSGQLRDRVDWARHGLAEVLIQRQEFERAETVLLETFRSVQDLKHEQTRATMLKRTTRLLVRLYEAWGRADKAEQWREAANRD
jgi:tetratricopeptide (TPR) repeat protein